MTSVETTALSYNNHLEKHVHPRSDETSVSETIRKALLVEAQTTLGKQKNTFYGKPVCVPLPKFCEKLLPTQNFTEIGQSAAELWPKNDLSNGGRPPS